MNTVRSILGEELYGKVQEKLGNEKGLIIDDGMLIPKHRFDCINISLKEHKQLVARLFEENERIKDRLALFNEMEIELTELKAERCILELIMQSKPKNYQAVRALINVSSHAGKKLETDVKKQLSDIKTSDSYLFYESEQMYKLIPVDNCANGVKNEHLRKTK